MLIVFEVLEKEGELVAVHDGALGVLVALGHDWEGLRDAVGESLASSLGESVASSLGEAPSFEGGAVEVEIELIVDENHRTRFKYRHERAVAERVRPGP